MSALLGVCTTRAGQTSTSWATSLAWTLSATRSVVLVDCDMEGGTIADLLYLKLDDRGLANCFGGRPVTTDVLAAQTLPVPDRPGLGVIPGLRGAYGFEIGECLRTIGPALGRPAMRHRRRRSGATLVSPDIAFPKGSRRRRLFRLSPRFHRRP